MSLTIRLLTFDKKLNSTAVPTLTGAPVFNNCYMLDDTDVINPAIRFIFDDNSTNPSGYNYAYIPNFNRYYFINSWHYNNRGWIAEMSCDVLATYKTAIGTQNLYILRCASESDGDVIDNLYPVKTSSTSSITSLTAPYVTDVHFGCFVIGVISKDAVYGPVRYTALSYNAFQSLCTALLDDTLLSDAGFSLSDASLALQKSIANPLQYIVSAVYIPASSTNISGTVQPKLNVWDYEITISNKELTSSTPYINGTQTVQISKHPATSARGNYLNASPYTRVELNFPPYGTIAIDTSITASKPYLYLEYSIDITNGAGTLRVYAQETASSTDRVLIAESSAMVGVPIQLSSVDVNYVGAVGSLWDTAASLAKGLFTGDFTGLGAGVGNAIQSMTPHQTTTGKNGTFYQYQFIPKLYCTFMDVTPDDNVDHGRPLMGFRTISLLSGYVMTDHAGIAISGALRAELEQIIDYLESGFYYE